MLDWDHIGLRTEENFRYYQVWDKVMDTYYLAIAAYTSFAWKDHIARKISLFLFTYRTIGVILFLLSFNRIFLFIFPNIFELFFLFYILYRNITKQSILMNTFKKSSLVLLCLLVPKIAQEYFLHVFGKMPWDIVRINDIFGIKKIFIYDINIILWEMALFILPAMALVFILLDYKFKSNFTGKQTIEQK